MVSELCAQNNCRGFHSSVSVFLTLNIIRPFNIFEISFFMQYNDSFPICESANTDTNIEQETIPLTYPTCHHSPAIITRNWMKPDWKMNESCASFKTCFAQGPICNSDQLSESWLWSLKIRGTKIRREKKRHKVLVSFFVFTFPDPDENSSKKGNILGSNQFHSVLINFRLLFLLFWMVAECFCWECLPGTKMMGCFFFQKKKVKTDYLHLFI